MDGRIDLPCVVWRSGWLDILRLGGWVWLWSAAYAVRRGGKAIRERNPRSERRRLGYRFGEEISMRIVNTNSS